MWRTSRPPGSSTGCWSFGSCVSRACRLRVVRRAIGRAGSCGTAGARAHRGDRAMRRVRGPRLARASRTGRASHMLSGRAHLLEKGHTSPLLRDTVARSPQGMPPGGIVKLGTPATPCVGCCVHASCWAPLATRLVHDPAARPRPAPPRAAGGRDCGHPGGPAPAREPAPAAGRPVSSTRPTVPASRRRRAPRPPSAPAAGAPRAQPPGRRRPAGPGPRCGRPPPSASRPPGGRPTARARRAPVVLRHPEG